MARIRTVKPEFFRHEALQDIETANPCAYAMLVFAGLWGHCDKQGVFEWRPRILKLDILPFLEFDMEKTLELLCSNGFVVKFKIDGKDYGHIPKFEDHQRITGKEAEQPKKYPTPPREAAEKQPGNIRETPGIPGREGKGREGNGSKPLAASPSGSTAVVGIPLNDGSEYGVTQEQVDEFAKLYPVVDVPQTLNEIRGWNLAHPQRRKTKRGILGHINSWLSKEQNRGPQRH
jgi:hypothetical protein